MKIRNGLYTLMLVCTFFVQQGISQVTSVNYQIRYNTTTCRWDAYLIIMGGSATTPQQRAQFNAQYSIVVPTGSTISVAQNFMPLNNNQTYTGTVPLKWVLSSSVIAPAVMPNSDFHSITPTLSPTSFYNNLATGDTVKLFSLNISPVTNCGQGIRIFENGVDPGSGAAGMGGGDFSNGFTMGSPNQIYNANTPKVNPPKPVLSAVTACSLGVEVDLTATTSACQTPLTYQWTGPNGYTGTTQDVIISPATLANAGTYSVTVTDARGCSATTSALTVSKPSAGPDQQGCAGTSATLTGTQPTTGVWTELLTNPTGSTLGSTTNGISTATFDALANGNFKYKYTSGACSDTVNVNVILPDAGPDPQPVGCFSSGTATMAAIGTGTWTVSNLSAGTATILNPSNPSTTISGFSAPGTYFLVWTVGTCTDTAQIQVGSNCSCTILNNSLTSVSPSVYCGTSGNINLDGGVASPPGGAYTWQYSLNGGTYADATGINNQEDYQTPNLSLGVHRYRRIYFVAGSPPCRDTSNIVLFNVNATPATPVGLTAIPNPVCLGNVVNLQVTNNPGATYTWTASSPNAGLVAAATNATTMNATASGIYTIQVTQTVNSCASSPASVNVTVNEVPPTPTALSIAATNPLVCGGNNGALSFSGLSPNATFTLNYTKNSIAATASILSNNSGLAVLSGLTAGTYANFSITNSVGCTSGVFAGPVVLTDPSAPSAPAGLAADPNPTCSGSVVSLSVTNNPGATYTWSASAPAAGLVSSTTNTTTMLPTASGFYTINVTQTVAGCTSVPASIGISINSTPATPSAGSITTVNPATCGASNGSISLTGLLPLTAYDFTYKKNNVTVNVNLTTNSSGIAIIANQSAGSYTDFKITNISGCASGTYPGPVNLTDPSTPAAPANLTAVPNPACLGNSVALSVTNNPGAVYSWTASSPSAGLVSSTLSNTTMLATATGTYTISVTQTVSGCLSLASTVVVTVNPVPPTPTAGTVSFANPTVCGGNNGSISISGLLNNTAYTLQYNKNAQPVSVNLTSNGTGIIQITGLTAGVYNNFKLTNASGCSSGTYAGPVTLTDPNAPAAPVGITANPNPVCPSVTVNLSVTNNPGATYTWSASSPNAGLVVSLTNATTMLSAVAGVYAISVTQTVAGCTSPSATVSVTVNAAPPTPVAGSITSTNPSTCGGTNGTILLSGLAANTNYTINYTKNSNPLTANITTDNSGVALIGNLTSGNYSGFTVINAQGCTSGTYSGIVSLSDPGSPSAPSNLSAVPNPVCLGNSVALSVTNNPGATYTWTASSPNAGLTIVNSNATTMLATAVGSYIINVTQTVAGCTSPAASVTVVVNPIPPTLNALNVSGNNPTTCGGNEGSIILSGLPSNSNYTLNYSKNSTPANVSLITNASGSATISGLTAGNYGNFVLTGTGGCQSGLFAGPVVLTDPPIPLAPAGLQATPNPVCVGTTINLSVINNPGATYTWTASSLQAGLVSSLTNTTTMSALAAGTYTISVTQTVNGCISPAAFIDVTINPAPPTPGVNTVSKTDPTTCLGTNGTISLSGYTPNTSFTINYTKNSIAVVVTLVSDNAGNIVITNLTAGTYSDFRVTNPFGCNSGTYTGAVQLNDPPAQSPPIGLTANPNPACLGVVIQLNVTNDPAATYTWTASSPNAGLTSGTGNQATLLPTVASVYSVSVTKTVAGCTSPFSTLNVTVNANPATPDQNAFTTINPTCGNANGVISMTGLLPNANYTIDYKFNTVAASQSILTNGSGTATLLGLLAGNYTDFVVTNSLGCASGTFAGPVSLTDPGLPVPPTGLAVSPDQICIRSTVNVSVNDNPGAVYSWSASNLGAGLQFSNTNSTLMMPTAPGLYTISVTQTVLGCTSLPASIIVDVKGDCYNPDFDVTYVNIPLTGDVSTNDVPLTMKTYGAAQGMTGNPSPCLPVIASDGTYTFTCAISGRYVFNVPVCNGVAPAMCTNIPLVITVLQPLINNNPPIANHDYIRTKTNVPIMLNLAANDRCQSAANCTLGVPVVTVNPLHGTYNPSTMLYVPTSGFMGVDSIRYRICQTPVVTPLNCEEAWAYITVVGGNAPNVTNAMDDYGQTPLNTPLVINAAYGLKTNDSDPEGDVQTITPMNVTVANKGTFTVQNDGSYIFNPVTGFVGPVDCPYEVCDNNSVQACDIATVHILVEPSIPSGSIGNKVWHDTNGDGVQTNNEVGISGVTVKLYTSTGTLIDTKITNNAGEYLFTQVLAGKYYIQFTKPNQYEFTFSNRGDDNLDSDVTNAKGPGTTSVFDLLPGDNMNSVDAGMYICAPIGDRVWYDTNKNDIWNTNENGINGIRVNLWKNHFGTWLVWDYKFTGPKPGSPSDDGYFSFCAPPGQYYIEVIMPPLGLVQALPKVGNNPLIDSDLNNANGVGTTSTFSLNSGQSKLDIGAGFYPMALAGNLVWLDANQNGVQEVNEPKVSNVNIKVYDANTHEMVKETTTDSNGEYSFDYLQKRDVYLKFSVPAQYSATIPSAASDDMDSDVDHSYGPNTTGKYSMEPGVNNSSIDLGIMFGVLPVDWMYINAKRKDNVHIIEWATKREVNVSHYEIERKISENGSFKSLGFKINPDKKSIDTHVYEATDTDTDLSGTYYYRVKQVDFDGKFTYSDIAYVSHLSGEDIKIYPSPALNEANLDLHLEVDSKVTIQLYDASSRLVSVIVPEKVIEQGGHTFKIDLTGLQSGVYNVVLSINAEQLSRKLIKID